MAEEKATQTRKHRPKKKLYQKPAILTESLTAVAALCNGSAQGGRKAAIPVCNANKLKS